MKPRLSKTIRWLSPLTSAVILLAFHASAAPPCNDDDADGYFRESGCGTLEDCNDIDPNTYPGAGEVCDGHDNDCSGNIDDSVDCPRECALPDRLGDNRQLTSDPNIDGDSTIVWTGSSFAIVWSAGIGPSAGRELFFARYDTLGQRIGDVVRLTNDIYDHHSPNLAWNGVEFGLTWYRADVFFMRLDPAGNPIDSMATVSEFEPGAGGPDGVWDGSRNQFLLAYTHSNDLHSCRVIDGAVRLSRLISSGNAPRFPSLVQAGAEYGVAWNDRRDGWSEIYFARVDSVGRRIGDEVRITHKFSTDSVQASMAWTGSEFVIVWEDRRDGQGDIYFTRVDAEGHEIGNEVAIVGDPADDRLPEIVWTGAELGLIWSRGDGTDVDVYFVRMDPLGHRLGREVLLNSEASGSVAPHPGIAWNGNEAGVVWNDRRTGGAEFYFTLVACDCVDGDGDVFSECSGDCDDSDGRVFPGAAAACDGVNNDCNDPNWPQVDPLDSDDDGDGYAECAADCNDNDGALSPGSPEVCNGIDDNCSGLIDDDVFGEDTDTDGLHNACDNCPLDVNPGQLDTDLDGSGNSCDNCTFDPNPDQADVDFDSRGDLCDNCIADANTFQDDFDDDRVGDACDNCIFERNPSQSNFDGDLEGDPCDLDDGLIYVSFPTGPEFVEWQTEEGFDTWNSYRGDLGVLRQTGTYSRIPGSNPLARRNCGLVDPWLEEDDGIAPGAAAFYLTTGTSAGIESDLGENSEGASRPNANPCD